MLSLERSLFYGPHTNIEQGTKLSPLKNMRREFLSAMIVAGCLMVAGRLNAQSTPAAPAQNPAPPAATPIQGNDFPGDTTNVPVMPSKGVAPLPEGTYGGDDSSSASAPPPRVQLPAVDQDPARSPDDPTPGADASDSSSSDSRTGLERVLADPDDEPQGKHRKLKVDVPEHQETSAEDIEVGKYELSLKNWKAALSRFESAMVLAPDEPEVYWGLAESKRHLGDMVAARSYYQKVVDYDPDSKHGREAMKALKDPEIANAKAIPPVHPNK